MDLYTVSLSTVDATEWTIRGPLTVNKWLYKFDMIPVFECVVT